MIERAPQVGEYLSDAAAAQFTAVQEGLQALGIDFEIAPRLVRGLDYYTGTTFEFSSDALDAAQERDRRRRALRPAVGRHGRPCRTAGIGFGIGIERVLIACDSESVFGAPAARADVFVVDLIGGTEALVMVEELRALGLRADRAVRRPFAEEAMGRRRQVRRALRRHACARTKPPKARSR